MPPVIITRPIPTARIAISDVCLKITTKFLIVGKDTGRRMTIITICHYILIIHLNSARFFCQQKTGGKIKDSMTGRVVLECSFRGPLFKRPAFLYGGGRPGKNPPRVFLEKSPDMRFAKAAPQEQGDEVLQDMGKTRRTAVGAKARPCCVQRQK